MGIRPYVLFTSKLYDSLENVIVLDSVIPEDELSDHNPIIANLEFKK